MLVISFKEGAGDGTEVLRHTCNPSITKGQLPSHNLRTLQKFISKEMSKKALGFVIY